MTGGEGVNDTRASGSSEHVSVGTAEGNRERDKLNTALE